MDFCQRIIVDAKLKRSTLYKRNELNATYYERLWEQTPFEEPVPCRFLGYRTLANGIVEHEAYDPEMGMGDERYLGHATYVKVALVIKNERTNPFYARLEDCHEA
jgi:hypothetical protein